MKRIVCAVEYDGAGFCGWQRQDHAPSVQACVEQALSKVADHPVKVVCAGRTDTGVHATWQIVHFESSAARDTRAWVLGGNANLPGGVRLLTAAEVSEDFHARFAALSRTYRYVILNRPVRSALWRNQVSWQHRPLDVEPMRRGAALLRGEHDFSSFRAVACQAKNPVRTVHRLDVTRSGEFVYLDICANAFLHHMVRNIAGVLMAVGAGQRPVDWVSEILALRDRTRGGVTAPASGLYLVGVEYPQSFGVATTGHLPVFG